MLGRCSEKHDQGYCGDDESIMFPLLMSMKGIGQRREGNASLSSGTVSRDEYAPDLTIIAVATILESCSGVLGIAWSV